MCPMCIMRTAMLALAAVSSGGLATFVAARVAAARQRGQKNCNTCDNSKEKR